jgi:DNA-binding NarL/FixJ family response regulator
MSNAEIAAELNMSVATAKTHVSRILSKLDARDRNRVGLIPASELQTARTVSSGEV